MKTMLATVGICFVMSVVACAPKAETTVSPAAFDDNTSAQGCCATKAAAAKASGCCASKAAATCPMSQKMSTEVN